MTEEIKALKTLIATWEKKAKQAEKMLTHLRAALAMELETETAAAAASNPKKRKITPPPLQPFSSKYEKRSEDYILEALKIRAMSLRQLQDTLAGAGKVYSDQAVNHTLKKLIKEEKIKKQPAPDGSAARSVYELDSQPPLDFPQRRVG